MEGEGRVFKSALIAALAILTLCATSARAAEDWPKWLGPRGDNISKEEISESWPSSGPKQLWSAPVGEGHASPVAAGGKVYLFAMNGNNAEGLACVDAKSGKVAWSQSYPIRQKAQYEGTRATPTIDGDRIYTLGQMGDLVCRQLADGKQVWRLNVLDATGTKPIQWGCASSPLIVGDRVFVQTGEKGPIAVAVNKKTGKVEWKSEARTKAGYAPLVHAEVGGKPQLFIFAGNAAGALDPATGRTLWSEPFQTEYDVNASTPVYHDGRVLFTAEYSSGHAAMYDVTGKSAKKLWETRDLKSRFQPVILDDGYVYGNSSGTPVCIRWSDGQLAWQAKDRNMQLGVGGSMLRVGKDKLIMMSDRGKLSLVRATPKGYELLSQAQVFDAQQVWATPLLYDGKLYCKGRDEFVCLDVSPAK
jgi:outer membrane protein assembly factor BamB